MHKDGRSEIGRVVALDIIFFSCCFWRVVLHTLVFLISSSAWFSFRFSLESPFTMFIFAFILFFFSFFSLSTWYCKGLADYKARRMEDGRRGKVTGKET